MPGPGTLRQPPGRTTPQHLRVPKARFQAAEQATKGKQRWQWGSVATTSPSSQKNEMVQICPSIDMYITTPPDTCLGSESFSESCRKVSQASANLRNVPCAALAPRIAKNNNSPSVFGQFTSLRVEKNCLMDDSEASLRGEAPWDLLPQRVRFGWGISRSEETKPEVACGSVPKGPGRFHVAFPATFRLVLRWS